MASQRPGRPFRGHRARPSTAAGAAPPDAVAAATRVEPGPDPGRAGALGLARAVVAAGKRGADADPAAGPA